MLNDIMILALASKLKQHPIWFTSLSSRCKGLVELDIPAVLGPALIIAFPVDRSIMIGDSADDCQILIGAILENHLHSYFSVIIVRVLAIDVIFHSLWGARRKVSLGVRWGWDIIEVCSVQSLMSMPQHSYLFDLF